MRNTALAIILIVSFASFASFASQLSADVVYLRNGKKYEARVVRTARKVRLELRHGVIEVDPNDIIHIEPSKLPAKPATKPSNPRPVNKDQQKKFTISDATQPEPVIFILMRNLAVTPPGEASFRLRTEIQNWQNRAHDMNRKVGSAWLGPEDFYRRRETFMEHLEEAKNLYRKKRRSGRNAPKVNQEQYRRQGALKLFLAAKTWADPTLRYFLMGIALYHKQDYRQAESMFRRAREQGPRVAAFWQGWAMTMQELNRHLEALDGMTQALRLNPESPYALKLVREGMKKIPGALIKRPQYTTALELVNQYVSSSKKRRSKGITWLTPGKAINSKEFSLPILPYDRLVFRQAVGVPIAKNALLVDKSAIEGAMEVFVRIDETTIVRGRIRQSSSYGGGKTSEMPLILLYVDDVEFKPLLADANTTFQVNESVMIYGLNAYEEMGSQVRLITAKIDATDSNQTLHISGSIVPGEGTAPVVTTDGRVVGFLDGKTDAMVASGGSDRFISVGELAPLLKRVKKRSTTRTAIRRYYGRRVKRKVIPKKVQGDHFVVYSTFAEKVNK